MTDTTDTAAGAARETTEGTVMSLIHISEPTRH